MAVGQCANKYLLNEVMNQTANYLSIHLFTFWMGLEYVVEYDKHTPLVLNQAPHFSKNVFSLVPLVSFTT